MKYSDRTQLYLRPNFFQFQTPTGGVFLRCVGLQCITVEGATRQTYDAINRAIGWPPTPGPVEAVQPSVAQIPSSAARAAR